MSPVRQVRPVVIIGAGPAGLTVGNILRAASVDCVILESESREFIERRPRAGVLEEGAVRGLEVRGLGADLLTKAARQSECEFRIGGERHRFDFAGTSGHHHWVYPQPLLVKDLLREYVDVRGGEIRFGVQDVALHGLDTSDPLVSYTESDTGRGRRICCNFVAGCDGARGVTSRAVPDRAARIARHDFGVGWLALLAEAPPSNDCAMFGIHQDGFAGHMARTPEVTRYYLQCPPGDDPVTWSHDRIWSELQRRLAASGAGPLTEGRLIEKRILDMHSHVVQPMGFGRLFLAGDAAHLIPPIAPKGMNLALHDAFLLGDALAAFLTTGDGQGLDDYSATCLRRVWDYLEFSRTLSEMFHGAASKDAFVAGTTLARVRRLFASPVAAAAFAEQYVGQLDCPAARI